TPPFPATDNRWRSEPLGSTPHALLGLHPLYAGSRLSLFLAPLYGGPQPDQAGERHRRELSAFAHATRHVVPRPFWATLRRGHRAGGCHAGGGGKRGRSSPGVGTRRGTARDFADGIPLGRLATSAGGA